MERGTATPSVKATFEGTASRVLEMLSLEIKANFASVMAALTTRFRSVDIEELRGMEFHRLVHTNESVEQLGMELQRLGYRAFPKAMI